MLSLMVIRMASFLQDRLSLSWSWYYKPYFRENLQSFTHLYLTVKNLTKLGASASKIFEYMNVIVLYVRARFQSVYFGAEDMGHIFFSNYQKTR